MRSARNKKIRNENEFAHELFAQYLITGKVTFNELPDSFFYTIPRRRIYVYTKSNEHDKNYYNEPLKSLGEELESHFNDLVRMCIGKIFVM